MKSFKEQMNQTHKKAKKAHFEKGGTFFGKVAKGVRGTDPLRKMYPRGVPKVPPKGVLSESPAGGIPDIVAARIVPRLEIGNGSFSDKIGDALPIGCVPEHTERALVDPNNGRAGIQPVVLIHRVKGSHRLPRP